MSAARVEAVVFDLGGVVLDSPLDTIADYERRHGLAPGSINRAIHERGSDGAWARHERGEIERPEFLQLLAAELGEAGMEVDTGMLMDRIDGSIRPRPAMVEAVRRLRRAGVLVAAITNNWAAFPAGGVRDEFDVFLESVVEGVRKPEPEIYLRALSRLGVPASSVVMLDDLGPNLKPARDLGMTTVKVIDVDQALTALQALTGVSLTD